LLLSTSAAMAAIEDSLLPMQFNGTVMALYDFRHPERSVNFFGRRTGNPLDNFPSTGFDSSKTSFSAMLGAALGGPAFENQVNGTVDKGRSSDRSIAVFIPSQNKIPLDIGLFHRKLDSRSENNHWWFWNRRSTLGDSLLNEHEALTDETGASLGYRRGVLTSSLKTLAYGRWEPTTCIGYPLFTKGYTITAAMSAALTDGTIQTTAVIDRHRDYTLKNNRAIEYTDEYIEMILDRRVGKGARIRAEGLYNSRLASAGRVAITLSDTTAAAADWKVFGGVYGDGHPDAGIDIALKMPTKRTALTLIVDAEYGYIPAERDLAFYGYYDTLKNFRSGNEFRTAGGALRINDTILSRLHPLPIMVELFGHYNDAPTFELTGFDGWNQQTTRTGSIRNSKKINSGGRMTLDGRWKHVDAHCWGIALVNTPNQPQFVKIGNEHTNALLNKLPSAIRKPLSSIGKVMGTTISLRGETDSTFMLGITYEHRDTITMSYPTEDNTTVFSYQAAHKSNTLSFRAKVPFPFPYKKCSLKPELRCTAGPFSLDKKNPRGVQYPGGEWIGPHVKVVLAGQF